MELSEFVIGQTFWTGSRKWRCTDVCSHFLAAIELYCKDDPSWYNGPPYAVPEYAFGEPQMEVCTPKAGTAAAKEWRMREGAEISAEQVVTMRSLPRSEAAPTLSSFPVPEGMELEDFAIGDLFLISVHLMRCVDIGTRVAIGFDLCHANKRLTKSQGEPYSPVWIIDEYDMDACTALYCLSHEELSWLRGNGKGGLRQHLKAVREAEMRENQGKADTGETTHVAKRSVPWVSLLMRDLADPQEAAGYLAAAREDSPQAYTTALRNIAKARRASRGRE